MKLLKAQIEPTKDKSKWFKKGHCWCKYFNSHKSIQHRQTKSSKLIGDVDKKVSDTSSLVTKAVLN